MSLRTKLPKKIADLEKVIEVMVRKGETTRNRKMIGWLVSYWYLQGIRDLTSPNWNNGTLVVGLGQRSASGHLDFRYEEVLTRMQTELGRLLKIDLSPVVKRRGEGLDAMRKASIGQVALDFLVPPVEADEAKRKALILMLMYGTFGLSAWKDAFGVPRMEVLPPWECMPIPCDPLSLTDLQGVMRVRWVPIEWLSKFSFGNKNVKKLLADKEVKTKELAFGSVPQDDANPAAEQMMTMYNDNTDRIKAAKTKLTETYVLLAEQWLEGEGQTLDRYIVWAGGKVLLDVDHSEKAKKPPMPVGLGHYFQTGGFYGRAFVEPLIPLNSEVEGLLSRLFENMQDLDNMGILLLPTTMGINETDLRTSGRPKICWYEPDYTTPNLQPQALRPVNTGPLPGKVMEQTIGLLERLSQQTSMLQGDAPGRVDSARGLGLLFETSTTPLAGPASSMASAFIKVYRAMLHLAKDSWDNMDIAALSLLDDQVAGITLNPQTGQINPEENSLPDPVEVNISVRSASPQSPEQAKAEMAESLKLQIITPREFRLMARKRGVDVPVGNSIEWENHRTAMLENIILFNDGRTPGQVEVAENEMHEEHLQTHDAFAARPEFKWAVPEVRDAVAAHRKEHMVSMGAYPDQLAYPEDEAAMQQEGAKQGEIGLPPEAGRELEQPDNLEP